MIAGTADPSISMQANYIKIAVDFGFMNPEVLKEYSREDLDLMVFYSNYKRSKER